MKIFFDHIMTLVLIIVISSGMSAQVYLSLPGINHGNPIPVTSAVLTSSSLNPNQGVQNHTATGDYFLVNRYIDIHSLRISTFSQKGKLIKGAVIEHTLADGTVLMEHLDYAFIQDHFQNISSNRTSTESFKLFFNGRRTETQP